MAKKIFKPGEKAPRSGQYKNIKTGGEVTVVRGEPLPPTPKKSQRYKLVDPTRHKRKK
ncbi:MAG: YjzC family protein [Candidatus Marinimicrobia bacterium]|nr:YjzC family protein [candidate division WOR-3 bacterium]MCK4448245.1 YjzC family protein [Candidatus Neomarinimicrobiota bacterium]